MSLVPYNNRGRAVYRPRTSFRSPFSFYDFYNSLMRFRNEQRTKYIPNPFKKKVVKKRNTKSSVPTPSHSEPVLGGLGSTIMLNKPRPTSRKQHYNLLKKFGVNALPSLKSFKSYSAQIIQTANKAQFDFVIGPMVGLHSKEMLDLVYSQNSLTDIDQKVVITSQTVELLLKNQSNTSMYVTLYKTKLLRDWTTSYGSFSTIISDGFNQIGLTNSRSQPFGASLQDNNKFNHYCKVIGRPINIQLNPGETRKLKMVSLKPHVRNFTYKDEGIVDVLKGQVFLTLKSVGIPTHDSTTSTNIGLSSAVLDCIGMVRWSYKIPSATQKRHVYYDDSITYPSVPLTFTSEDITEDTIET